MKQFIILTSVFALLASASKKNNASDPALTVSTRTGVFTGVKNPDFPQVREFRNIPFAQAPVGKLRFMPPEPLPYSNEHHYSTRFPPSCPQSMSETPSLWNLFVPDLLCENGQQNQSSGLPLLTGSEDCLSLAIWTPYDVSPNASLPVAFFMTGGGFSTGGVDISSQLGEAWVNRTQSHIVVTINYRVNIFGFPNAAGSRETPNVGILDQRLALEWVAENIASFGGDPRSIMLWGQSAGSQSVDYHNYAFWENPISHASFSQSGTALKGLSSSDFVQSNFTFVAKNLGCDFPTDHEAELECMQQVPWQQITEFISTYNSKPGISFGPIADEEIIFSDYPARAAAGLISPNPAIFSDAANNDASLTAWPSNVTAGPNQTVITEGTLSGWVCPTANSSQLRHEAGVITYRYQFAGTFPNRNPYKWLGAYHSSDLVMNFGTYFHNDTNATVGPTTLEIETSQTMQDYILAFMKDPTNGPAKLGWEPYTYGSNVLRFGADGIAVQNVSGYAIDGPCYGNGTYNSFP